MKTTEETMKSCEDFLAYYSYGIKKWELLDNSDLDFLILAVRDKVNCKRFTPIQSKSFKITRNDYKVLLHELEQKQIGLVRKAKLQRISSHENSE